MSDLAKIVLNEDQKEAIRRLTAFMRSDNRTCALTGYAGTGKSTIINRFILSLPGRTRLVMTAPTHKAVQVLNTMRAKLRLPCDCRTVQSLLRGTMDAAYSKKRILYSGVDEEKSEYDLIIVDEASMVDSAMFNELCNCLKADSHVKIIFVGDPVQLPPAGGKKLTRAFLESDEKIRLETIVRQAKDNPILRFTEEIRQALREKREIDYSHAVKEADESGVLIGGDEFFERMMRRCFSKREYLNDGNKYRAIAFRNDRVTELNAVVRSVMYPGVTDKYIVGERVVALTPWWTPKFPTSEGRKIIVNTDHEGVVHAVSESFHPDAEYKSVPCYSLMIEMGRGFDQAIEVYAAKEEGGVCEALDDLRLPILSKCEKKLGENAEGKQVELRNPAWIPYHEVLKPFANVRCNDAVRDIRFDNIRPAHAMTSHKSQGSTFRSVFVDARDIIRCCRRRNDLELGYRAFYVAVSRAEFGVCILDPR